ncbi:MAG: [FeFe] hydrogenase H-cluster radical SAM maturase HydG [Candidatus Omnitrophica bacterium]|nr:[FeFe] hydrogenase H-cluster radical SAM maturase HydG [Candidatus Omnitrophota bacterium]
MKIEGAIEREWAAEVIKPDEFEKYLDRGRDFIDDRMIDFYLSAHKDPDPQRIRDIISKSLGINTLLPEETACLLNVRDEGVWGEIFEAAVKIKTKVYDNPVVTFAPLYCSNLCVNNCLYCGFRGENNIIKRRQLTMEEIKKEVEAVAGRIGHKRLIVVCGEHPFSGADYICRIMREIYSVKVHPVNCSLPHRNIRGTACRGEIRRVNVNAAPMSVDDLRKVKEAGIGTYQVFQETYHPQTYTRLHPVNTIKGNYHWRLYALHRAMEAGIDDVAIGALFGLYDWRFEVMGMLCHARDLEEKFGVGPHTVSFPRIEPAANTPFVRQTGYGVSDRDFKRLVAVLRLSIPYAGMIITCRERPEMIRDLIPLCTQRDASSRIGIGAYSDIYDEQEEERQQFILGDTRSLDEVIRELASLGYITSFCTAGYRCGRTGGNIMTMLKSGKEGCLCKLNAVLTFQEWLEDFASLETKVIGEAMIAGESAEIEKRVPGDFSPELYRTFREFHERIKNGERDLCF